MRQYVLFLLTLLLSGPAFGQFFISENNLQFRIYNKDYELIKNASVVVNGYELRPCTTCKAYDHEFWYELEINNIKSVIPTSGKLKLQFTHPDYQSIDDSIYLTGGCFFALAKNDNYVYHYNKAPYVIHPDHYFVEVRDSVQFEYCMRELNVSVLNKQFYCGWFKSRIPSGPLVYTVKVSPDKFPDFLNSCKSGHFNFGVLITKDTAANSANATGISNKIGFTATAPGLEKSISDYLKTVPEVEGFYLDNYSNVYYEVSIKQENINEVIGITEKLLGSGYFQLPNNQLMVYECPD